MQHATAGPRRPRLDPAQLFVLAASRGPRTVVIDHFLGDAPAPATAANHIVTCYEMMSYLTTGDNQTRLAKFARVRICAAPGASGGGAGATGSGAGAAEAGSGALA